MKKKKIGTVSYNIYCNFTNYGSALQTWALHQAIKKVLGNYIEPILVDYCPKSLADKDPLNPFENMWDKDKVSRKMCELSMPAIRENFYKFERFYNEHFVRTSKKYTAQNFNDISVDEDISGFVCGSDTIFCPDEFGIDDGYYANYESMRGKSVSYAASFGDPHFTRDMYSTLNSRLLNFMALGLRENLMIPYVENNTNVPVKKVIDPTLLLTSKDYDTIAEDKLYDNKYLLLYARRYNPMMEDYAEKLAAENGWKIIEISLRATNADKPNRHMFYEAGVEEFLSLVKYAECVITNSYHGMIFAVQYCRPFYVFSREQCDTKITELLELFGLSNRMMNNEKLHNLSLENIDYEIVHSYLNKARKESLGFLDMELRLYL